MLRTELIERLRELRFEVRTPRSELLETLIADVGNDVLVGDIETRRQHSFISKVALVFLAVIFALIVGAVILGVSFALVTKHTAAPVPWKFDCPGWTVQHRGS